jgi:hypothetical protein
MTKFRAPGAFLACTTAIAFAAAASPAAALEYKLDRSFVKSWSTSADAVDDLPAPPKLTGGPKAPQPALNGYAKLTANGTHVGHAAPGSSPQTSTFKFRTTPLWGVRHGR